MTLTKDQLMIRDMVRQFARKEIAPLAVQLDQESRFADDIFKKN